MRTFVISLVSYNIGDRQFPTEIRFFSSSVLSLIDALQGVSIFSKNNLGFSTKLHGPLFSYYSSGVFADSSSQFHYASHNLDFLACRMRINHSLKTWIPVTSPNVSIPSMKMFSLSVLSVKLMRVKLLHLVQPRCFHLFRSTSDRDMVFQLFLYRLCVSYVGVSRIVFGELCNVENTVTRIACVCWVGIPAFISRQLV